MKDKIKAIIDKIQLMSKKAVTEEATKTALILPFIQMLGYDVFDPFEVVPEFVADLGIKKGEKVDYAIFKDNQPQLLIECKPYGEKLEPHNSQLFRYFHVVSAKFAILTDGCIYKFYTDLLEPNKMDEVPFFEIDLMNIKDIHIEELKKFHKDNFNVQAITNSASELKYTNGLRLLLHQELTNPSPDFVKHFAKQIYHSILTSKVLDTFSVLLKKSIQQYINDSVTNRLEIALSNESNILNSNLETEVPPENKIITTQEELEGFMIIKSILRQKININRIVYRDAQTYFAVLLDDNNRKPICRFVFNTKNQYLIVFDNARNEVKYKIDSLDDIYKYGDDLLNIIDYYDSPESDK